jgi:hypothetical protein
VVHPNRILKQVNGLLPGNGSFAQQSSNVPNSAAIGLAAILDQVQQTLFINPYIG